jgi:hypothetical protein
LNQSFSLFGKSYSCPFALSDGLGGHINNPVEMEEQVFWCNSYSTTLYRFFLIGRFSIFRRRKMMSKHQNFLLTSPTRLSRPLALQGYIKIPLFITHFSKAPPAPSTMRSTLSLFLCCVVATVLAVVEGFTTPTSRAIASHECAVR